ncbi:hypothetical protein Tsubulata_034009 [Turnera subulata]|uniref:BTB domain-containing protein n=1 Tax=Turnera subulata TaxID=218843 RepID=A0A9Q0JG92_9ROSI|nr:hypothetical protein Tsubulata_034009 [Turnera subulata]
MFYNFDFAFDNPDFSDKRLIIKIEEAGSQYDKNKHEIPALLAAELCKIGEEVAELPPLKQQRSSGMVRRDDDDNCSSSPAAPKVITIHIVSAILASKSPFFRDLFSKHFGPELSLELMNVHEEAPFLNLLRYMYGCLKSLHSNISNAGDWIDLLIVAQRYQVKSCVKYCCKSLLGLMSMQTVPFYFYLASVFPNTEEAEEEVQHLIKESSKFIIKNWNGNNWPEALWLPFKGLQALLLADDLEVDSEESVLDFFCKWAYQHYPKTKKRREFFHSHLDSLVRLPFLSIKSLEEILGCHILDPDYKRETVFKALLYKAAGGANFSKCSNMPRPRAYKFCPVRVVAFDSPKEGCIVYLDLKKEACNRLCSKDRRFTEPFLLGNEEVQLELCYDKNDQRFQVGMTKIKDESKLDSLTMHVAARIKTTEEFTTLETRDATRLTDFRGFMGSNIFPSSGESKLFINGTLHLRVELVITKFAASMLSTAGEPKLSTNTYSCRSDPVHSTLHVESRLRKLRTP